MADVYIQATGMYATDAVVNFDLSETLLDIADAAKNDGNFDRITFDLLRVNSGDGLGVFANTDIEGGLPTFNDPPEVIKAGDLFAISDFDGNVGSGPWRVYRRASDMALVLATVNANPAATAGTGEFFLDANFNEIAEPAAGSQGFSPVQCMAGYESNDDITCELIPANCGANAINDPNDNTMCVCENTETHRFVDGSTTICELIPQDNMEETEMENEMETEMEEMETEMEESQNTQSQPQTISSGRPKEFAYIGAGVFIIGFAASYIAGGGFPIFNYSPDFGYSLTESGYSANIGGRADFRKDNWHLYYSANQQNANGNFADFRYTSGGKYTADFWTATFSESVSGETADYNFALSANLQNGIWKISPVYRLHSEYEKGETETQNELNLQGNFRYNRWTIRPSAGFRWENHFYRQIPAFTSFFAKKYGNFQI